MSQTPLNDDYDNPWKEVLEHAFPEFMAFFFPQAHAQIDWAQGHEIKNTELRQIVRDAELGKRYADTLMQVKLLSGAPLLVYIHIEIQGQRDATFPQRMFTYNYRIYDRCGVPTASMAILADEDKNWRPNSYGFEILGCRHTLEFPIVKLIDYANQNIDLEKEVNPFALVTAAHLRTRGTKHDPEARYQAKLSLIRQFYHRGWTKQRILDLFAVIDWMMFLPDTLAQKLILEIEKIEGEKKVRYVTSVERLIKEREFHQGEIRGEIRGKAKGKLEGKIEGSIEEAIKILQRLLAKRFGPLSETTYTRLNLATLEQLEAWTDRILDANSLEQVFQDN
jgi:hypothetical protein